MNCLKCFQAGQNPSLALDLEQTLAELVEPIVVLGEIGGVGVGVSLGVRVGVGVRVAPRGCEWSGLEE